jgi:hypothetical protein
MTRNFELSYDRLRKRRASLIVWNVGHARSARNLRS